MTYPRFKARIRLLLSVLSICAAIVIPQAAAAQANYPDRPVTLVIPFGPGGETDIFARAISKEVGDELGQPIVVVNRPGATGVVASEFVKGSDPDGYTLMFGTAATHALNMSVFKDLRYHPVNDFAPVAFVGRVPLVVYATLDMPQPAKDFIAELRANPDKYFYGSAGISTSFLGMEIFKEAAQVKVVNVPYKGSAQAMQGMLGNQVQMMGGSLGLGQSLVQAGKVRAIGVMSRSRLAAAPDIATFEESLGLPLEVGTWNVVIAPKGTPEAIVSRLNAAFNSVLKRTDIVERLAGLGIKPVSDSTPESTAKHINSEIEVWAQATKLAGVTPK